MLVSVYHLAGKKACAGFSGVNTPALTDFELAVRPLISELEEMITIGLGGLQHC